MIRLILNILWFVCGGWISGLLWILGGALLALTIVGLPYTGAAWRIAAIWAPGRWASCSTSSGSCWAAGTSRSAT